MPDFILTTAAVVKWYTAAAGYKYAAEKTEFHVRRTTKALILYSVTTNSWASVNIITRLKWTASAVTEPGFTSLLSPLEEFFVIKLIKQYI